MSSEIEKTVRKTLWTGAELMSFDFPPIKWIVDGLIPEGLTVLIGSPKLGKSWLALSICAAVATGGVVLGKIPVEIGQVLYLALEDTGRRLKDRLLKIGAEPSYNLCIGLEVKRGVEGIEEIRAWLIENPQARLIIIDTWMRFSSVKDNNDYGQTTLAAAQIKTLADEFGVAIILIHHAKKGSDEQADFIDRSIGSTGLPGAADTICVLHRKRGADDVTLSITGRDVDESEYALTFDRDMMTWKLLGTRSEVQQSETRQAIYQVIKESDEPLPPKVITEKVNEISDKKRSGSTIRTLLQKMLDDQTLVSMSGVYKINSHNPIDTVDNRQQVPETPIDTIDSRQTYNEGSVYASTLSTPLPANNVPLYSEVSNE